MIGLIREKSFTSEINTDIEKRGGSRGGSVKLLNRPPPTPLGKTYFIFMGILVNI